MRNTLLAVERTRACSSSSAICTWATGRRPRACAPGPSRCSPNGCTTWPWRPRGAPTRAYRPIDRIDLVLLGDVFDLLRSRAMACRSQVRPWGNPHAPEYVDQIAHITAGILASEPGVADRAPGVGRPRASGCRLPSVGRAGDRRSRASARPGADPLHGGQSRLVLPPAGPDLRRPAADLIEQMGLANRPTEPVPARHYRERRTAAGHAAPQGDRPARRRLRSVELRRRPRRRAAWATPS